MITIEQLKEARNRVDELKRYLNIEDKKSQLEEEELKTQAPEFWQDQKRAEQQMKLVKGIKFWIEGYNNVDAAVNEAQIAFDFYKEGAMTEEEVDEAYNTAIAMIEDLEMRNMLRKEEDKLGAVLKIVAGAGGTEAQDWAQMLMRMYLRWCEKQGYKAEITNMLEGDDPKTEYIVL